MQLHKATYVCRVGGKTVTRQVTVPALSPAIAENVIGAWLRLSGQIPLSVTSEA